MASIINITSIANEGARRGYHLTHKGITTPQARVGARWKDLSPYLQEWIRVFDIQYIEELAEPVTGDLRMWVSLLPRVPEQSNLRNEFKCT